MSLKKQYSKQFKEEALELAESMGNVSAAARQLGISNGAIHAWKRQLQRRSGNPEKQLSEAELENQRLRKENAELKKVNHVLKAAAAFFSQDHLK